jgi:hypothetical protein
MTLTALPYMTTLSHIQHIGQAVVYWNISQPVLSIAAKKPKSESVISPFKRNKGHIPSTLNRSVIVTEGFS